MKNWQHEPKFKIHNFLNTQFFFDPAIPFLRISLTEKFVHTWKAYIQEYSE